MLAVPLSSARASGFLANRSVKAPVIQAARSRTTVVKTQALFGFGAAKSAPGASYICIDCGFIYDGKDEWKNVPSSYKCPACTSTKNRFKTYKGAVKGRPSNTGAAMQKRKAEKAW